MLVLEEGRMAGRMIREQKFLLIRSISKGNEIYSKKYKDTQSELH